MYTLYTSSGACSMAVHCLLEELGVPYKANIIALKNGDHLTPEYKAINPRSKVPVLIEDGGAPMFEVPSISQYLADKHGAGTWIAAPGTPARALQTQWLSYASSGVHPHWTRIVRTARFGDDGAQASVLEKALEMWNAEWDHIDGELSKRAYCAGDKPSVADFYIYVCARWGATREPKPTLSRPNVARFHAAMAARPAIQRVLAANGLS